jgi:hypothetical protein
MPAVNRWQPAEPVPDWPFDFYNTASLAWKPAADT